MRLTPGDAVIWIFKYIFQIVSSGKVRICSARLTLLQPSSFRISDRGGGIPHDRVAQVSNFIKLFLISSLDEYLPQGNTKGGSITVPLNSHLTGLELVV